VEYLGRLDWDRMDAAMAESRRIISELRAFADVPVAISPRELHLTEGGAQGDDSEVFGFDGGRGAPGGASRPISRR